MTNKLIFSLRLCVSAVQAFRSYNIPTSGRYRCLPLTTSQAMLVSMKNIIISSILSLLLFSSFSLHAGLYKGLDAEGNVAYSDEPFDNAEKLTLPPISVVDAPRIKPEPIAEKEEVDENETKYTRFSIISPKNNATIWNESQLVVSTKITPELNTALGHTTWLIMDGKALVKKSQSTSLLIGRADRGEHTIQAQIRDKKGKILKRTKSITLHIKNTVISKPSPG